MPLTKVVTDESGTEIAWSLSTSADHVWELLTGPESVSLWLGAVVEGEIAPHASFTVDHGEGTLCRSKVLTYAEPRVLRYSWEFPDEPPSEVELKLESSGAGTALTVSHSLPSDLVDSYQNGWPVHLTFLEAAALGEPLPPSMFWKLHATMSRLSSTRDSEPSHRG